jgi:hypothetical protein
MNKQLDAPNSPTEITVEWLQNILFPKTSGSEIVSIEIDKDFGPWSLLGKAVRVKLDYSKTGSEPKSVIVKFQVSTSDPEREGEIYQLLSVAKAPFIPRVFSTFGNGNLIMEDMTPTHSVLKKDFTIPQIRSVISILADVQGRFWHDTRVPKYDLSHFINSININMGQSWDIFKNRYQDQLGKETADFEWMLENPKIVAKHYNSNPTTLNHGDVNASNLLFPNDGSDSPILIDWQLAAQKVLPFDLSYFLVKSLAVEQRRENEDVLLKEYYELLPDQIRASYAFTRLILDYRACATRSMLSAVMRVGPRYDSHPNRFEAADKLAIRVIEAVRDLKPVEAIRELQKHGA